MDADRPLRRRDLAADPLAQLERWLDEARAGGVVMPEAACLATAARDGRPSARMVLLRGLDARGLAFHTSYESRKGRELAENPRGALVLYWAELGRQVRADGRVEGLPQAESDAYFASRPPEHRLSAWASRQSEPVESRAVLEARVTELRARFGGDPPRPPFWGGYRLLPDEYEFWQHRADRLHDRFRYLREPGGGWRIERLSP